MPDIKLPDVLQQALDAWDVWKACDYKVHPRIATRLWQTYLGARATLKAEYPQLENWLFGYPYRHIVHTQTERLAELRRLIAACKGD